jgi:hypothetical protein
MTERGVAALGWAKFQQMNETPAQSVAGQEVLQTTN